jgi:hypothetical protein
MKIAILALLIEQISGRLAAWIVDKICSGFFEQFGSWIFEYLIQYQLVIWLTNS